MADNKNTQTNPDTQATENPDTQGTADLDTQGTTNTDAQGADNLDAQGTANLDTQGTADLDTQGTTNTNTQSTNGESNMSKKQEKKVPVFIPKESRNDTERYVAVNGERILIKTGVTVEVPERFAEVIRNSEKMAVVAADFIDQNIKNN